MFPPLLDPLANWTAEQLLQSALLQFFAFTLVVVRLSGLMSTAPVFANLNVPLNVRVLLVVVMAMLITPTLPQPAASPQQALPASTFDYAWIVAGELGLGLMLGLGTTAVLSGLQMAGQLIDQQTGIGLGEVFNPELDAASSLTGETLYVFGTTVFLVLGGHLLVISALIDTFQTLPPGEAFVSLSAIEFLSGLVHQSLVLALQAAAPLLATLSLVALAMGFLGHTVPQMNILVIGFPIRALIGLLVLALALTGTAHLVADLVPAAIEGLRQELGVMSDED